MAYNPKLIEELLGKQVAELFDSTVEVIPAKQEFLGNLKVGDALVFNLKPNPNFKPREFIITVGK
jgi:hypothetical protein